MDPRTSNPIGACTHCWQATEEFKELNRLQTRNRVQLWRLKRQLAAEGGSSWHASAVKSNRKARG